MYPQFEDLLGNAGEGNKSKKPPAPFLRGISLTPELLMKLVNSEFKEQTRASTEFESIATSYLDNAFLTACQVTQQAYIKSALRYDERLSQIQKAKAQELQYFLSNNFNREINSRIRDLEAKISQLEMHNSSSTNASFRNSIE